MCFNSALGPYGHFNNKHFYQFYTFCFLDEGRLLSNLNGWTLLLCFVFRLRFHLQRCPLLCLQHCLLSLFTALFAVRCLQRCNRFAVALPRPETITAIVTVISVPPWPLGLFCFGYSLFICFLFFFLGKGYFVWIDCLPRFGFALVLFHCVWFLSVLLCRGLWWWRCPFLSCVLCFPGICVCVCDYHVPGWFILFGPFPSWVPPSTSTSALTVYCVHIPLY